MQISNPILRLALPSVVSNITVPLLGLVDMAVVGHLGSAHYIAAIAIGSTIFSMLYWVFAFLRMGTTGIVSQAYGADDVAAQGVALRRALRVAWVISGVMLVVQVPFLSVVRLFMHPEAGVWEAVEDYFYVCVWGAPGVLSMYALTGWYIGRHNTRRPMWMAIVQNVVNILASLFFVFVLHMEVRGVALGTVVGIYVGMACGVPSKDLRGACPSGGWAAFFSVSRDLFLRTLCLVAVTVYFTSAGTQQGSLVVAANALLMQLFILFSYFTDGLANAAEALSGEAAGRHDWRALRALVRSLFRWGLALSLAFSLLYIAGGRAFLGLLTDQRDVLRVAYAYLPWVYVIPFAGLMAFIWDGVFIGLTFTRGMLVAMFAAMVVFFAAWFGLKTTMANHGLWLAFVLYLLTRGGVQSVLAYRKF